MAVDSGELRIRVLEQVREGFNFVSLIETQESISNYVASSDTSEDEFVVFLHHHLYIPISIQ